MMRLPPNNTSPMSDSRSVSSLSHEDSSSQDEPFLERQVFASPVAAAASRRSQQPQLNRQLLSPSLRGNQGDPGHEGALQAENLFASPMGASASRRNYHQQTNRQIFSPYKMKNDVFSLIDIIDGLKTNNIHRSLSQNRFSNHASAPTVMMNGSMGDMAPVLPRRSSDTNLTGRASPESKERRPSLQTDSMRRAPVDRDLLFLGSGKATKSQKGFEGTLVSYMVENDEHSDLTNSTQDDTSLGKEHGYMKTLKKEHEPTKQFYEDPKLKKREHEDKSRRRARGTSRSRIPQSERARTMSWDQLKTAKLVSDKRTPRRGTRGQGFKARAARRWSVEEATKDFSFDEMLKTPPRKTKTVLSKSCHERKLDTEEKDSPTSVSQIDSLDRSLHRRLRLGGKSAHTRLNSDADLIKMSESPSSQKKSSSEEYLSDDLLSAVSTVFLET